MISASRDYRSRVLHLRLGQSYCVKFLGQTPYFRRGSLHPGVRGGAGIVVQSPIRLTQD